MERVLRLVAAETHPLPAHMVPLEACLSDEQARQRMLQAHQALAALTPENREVFARLIEHLHREVEQADPDAR